jgi:hypothetical protein
MAIFPLRIVLRLFSGRVFSTGYVSVPSCLSTKLFPGLLVDQRQALAIKTQ